MADNSGGSDGPSDPNLSATPLSSLHIKSRADLARLANQLPVNWSQLPQMPFFGAIIGKNDEYYRAAVAMSVLEARWLGQRSLTTDEMQLIANQTAKAVVTQAYELPAMLGTTWIYESRGRADFRFPFYKPDMSTFDPNVFPSKKIPMLRGTNARFQWHMTRAFAYCAVAHTVLSILFGSYAMSVKNTEFIAEPALTNLHQSISKAQADRRLEQRRHSNTPLPLPSMPPLSAEELSRGGAEKAGTYDSMEEGAASSSDRQGSTDQQGYGGYQQYQQNYQSTRFPQQQKPGAAAAASSPSYDDSDYDLDGLDDEGYHDDASPVAPSVRGKPWRNQSAGGGSAWDRVRSQATGDAVTPQQQQQQQQQYLGGPKIWPHGRRFQTQQQPSTTQAQPASAHSEDDYNYRAAEEEKAYPREDAQKAFDAMLDRERKGENDDERRRR